MLRYIFLLCFLINLDLGFCYNYISGNRRVEKARRGRVARRHSNDFEDIPLQVLDVANFLSADADEGYAGMQGMQEAEELDNRKSYQPERRERRQDVLSPADPAPLDGLSSYQRQLLTNRNLVHKKKKCALNKVFPFFSHDKPEKKMCKGFCIYKKEKENKEVAQTEKPVITDLHKEQKSQNTNDDFRVEKRFAEQICPRCKMKFLEMKKRFQPKMIHNSRQYFANNADKEIETSSKQYKNDDLIRRLNTDMILELRRRKRKLHNQDLGR